MLGHFCEIVILFTQKGNARRLPPQANIQLTNKNSLTHLRSHTRAETLIQYKTNSTYIQKPIRCTYDTTFANFMLHLVFVTFVAVFCMFTSHHSNEYFVFVYHSAISSTLRCQNFMYDFSLWRTANLWSLFILLNSHSVSVENSTKKCFGFMIHLKEKACFSHFLAANWIKCLVKIHTHASKGEEEEEVGK